MAFCEMTLCFCPVNLIEIKTLIKKIFLIIMLTYMVKQVIQSHLEGATTFSRITLLNAYFLSIGLARSVRLCYNILPNDI